MQELQNMNYGLFIKLQELQNYKFARTRITIFRLFIFFVFIYFVYFVYKIPVELKNSTF